MLTYVLLAAICGIAHGAAINEGRIVGGEKVNIESFPYQVSLFYYGHHICGGAILNNNYIITAGHCVQRFEEDALTVHYGLNNTKEAYLYSDRYSEVEAIFLHPNYTITEVGSARNDIAILKVAPIDFNYDALPVKLGTHEPVAGQVIVITGYGRIGESNAGNNDLLAVSVPISKKTSCEKTYKRYGVNHINEEVFCAGYLRGGKDSCQGDSGGPAVLNGKLVGIVSFGIGCARRGIPGVYTNIANYYQWIMQTLMQ